MTLHHCLKVAHQVVNLSKQNESDVNRLLLLEFKSYSDTVSANCYCQVLQNLVTRSRTDVRLNSAVASSAAQQCLLPFVPHSSRPRDCCVMGGADILCIPLGLSAVQLTFPDN